MRHELPSGRLVFGEMDEQILEWTYEELQSFMFHWNEGYSLQEIGEEIGRSAPEVALLIMSIEKENGAVMLSRPKGIRGQKPLALPDNYEDKLQAFYIRIKGRGGSYTCFDYTGDMPGVELFWPDAKVDAFIKKWHEGKHIGNISEELKRDRLDAALLVFDLGAAGLLKPRKNGLEGDGYVAEEICRRKDRPENNRTGQRTA